MCKNIIFDYGNTLVQFYSREQFPEILKCAINNVIRYLEKEGLYNNTNQHLWENVKKENYESEDFQVRALEERLIRIFGLRTEVNEKIIEKICDNFMEPILNVEHCYDDTIETLAYLKSKDYMIYILSNTPWGSASRYWKNDLRNHNINRYIDEAFYCYDIGWRKPSEKTFQYVLNKLDTTARECIFIGDDPRWDFIGPQKVGMNSIIIDRNNNIKNIDNMRVIYNLNELKNIF